MTSAATTVYELTQLAAPSLPLTPYTYDYKYHDQSSNVLRLYFNRIDNTLNAITGKQGAQYLTAPYGAFQNKANVTLATANTATLVPINSTDYASGMSYASGAGSSVS